MGDIFDAAGHKLATLGEDKKVRNLHTVIIGHIEQENHLYNNMERLAGRFDNQGYVYDARNMVMGKVHADGKVYDQRNIYVGKVVGDHIESGGAALLLLVR
jgi:hypothetical protein